VAEALVVTSSPGESLAVQRLALSLTEGLGPKRGRSLVERLGGVQNVFRASLGLRARKCRRNRTTRHSGRWHLSSYALRIRDGGAFVLRSRRARPDHFQRPGERLDAAAHCGAINAKGKAVAVLGTGVDIIYPKENTRLTEQIITLGGALISELPMNTFAAPQNFPIRNRIISGISIGVLVIEVAEYSGTRITSRCALEQNREVFAVPGNVTNKNSWGT